MGVIHKLFGKRAEKAALGLFNEMLKAGPRHGKVPPPEDGTRFEDETDGEAEEAGETGETGGLCGL